MHSLKAGNGGISSADTIGQQHDKCLVTGNSEPVVGCGVFQDLCFILMFYAY